MTVAREILRAVAFSRTDAVKREVFGEVGIPLPDLTPGQVILRSVFEQWKAEGRVHYDNGCFRAEDLVELAHRFLIHSRLIDEEHDGQFDKGEPIESYIALDDSNGYHAGGWVLGVYIGNDVAWNKASAGEFDSYSVYMLAVPEEVEILVEDDAAGPDGTKVQERIKLTYFTDPKPIAVTLTGRPATGIPWQVVRCVEECGGEACKHTCRKCIGRSKPVETASADAPSANPIHTSTTKEPAMKDDGLLRKILRHLSPAAKAEGIDLEALLVERSTEDFSTVWAARKSREDLWDAFCTFQDVTWCIQTDDEITDKAVALAACVDQFANFLRGQMAMVAVGRTEDDEKRPVFAATTVERALPNLVVALIERVGKKFSKDSVATMQACLDELTATATKLQDLMDAAEAAGSETNRHKEEPMDPKTQELIDGLKTQNAELVARMEKLEKSAEPIANAENDEAQKAVETLRTENAALVARMEALEKRRPAPKGQADEVTRTEGQEEDVFKGYFRERLGLDVSAD